MKKQQLLNNKVKNTFVSLYNWKCGGLKSSTSNLNCLQHTLIKCMYLLATSAKTLNDRICSVWRLKVNHSTDDARPAFRSSGPELESFLAEMIQWFSANQEQVERRFGLSNADGSGSVNLRDFELGNPPPPCTFIPSLTERWETLSPSSRPLPLLETVWGIWEDYCIIHSELLELKLKTLLSFITKAPTGRPSSFECHVTIILKRKR